MTQKLPEILTILETALRNQKPVTVHTMEKRKLHGTVAEIEPATVKPYEERAMINLETDSGRKRLAAYTIGQIDWA